MKPLKTSVVKIDFDYINEPLVKRLIWALRLQYICIVAKCDIRRTKKGYHVRIYGNFDSDLPLRAYLMDDEYHIKVDLERRLTGFPGYDTVFNAKLRKGKIVYIEESVELDEIVEKVLRLPTPL